MDVIHSYQLYPIPEKNIKLIQRNRIKHNLDKTSRMRDTHLEY